MLILSLQPLPCLKLDPSHTKQQDFCLPLLSLTLSMTRFPTVSQTIDQILLKPSQLHKTVKFSPQHLNLGTNYTTTKFHVGTNFTSLHSSCTAPPKSIVLAVQILILPTIKSAFLISHMHTAQYAHSTLLHCITQVIFLVC